MKVMTGGGTFESYFSVGAGSAATPDGRLNGQPTASDCSPQPFAQVNILNVVTLHLHDDCMQMYTCMMTLLCFGA